MKKMKRLLVAILSGLTAIACIAGVSACKNSADKNSSEDKAPVESVVPDTNININLGGDPVVCVHDYSVVYDEMAPTCDEDGFKDMGCSKCGVEKRITVKALGHDYADATCTAAGKCSRCDAAKPVLDHDYADATCTANKTCTVCGEEVENTKLPHTYDENAVATCTQSVDCEVCGEVIKEMVEHDWKSAFGTKMAAGTWATTSYTEEGYGYWAADCTKEAEGYESFEYCDVCFTAAKAVADADLAFYMVMNNTELTTEEKNAYQMAYYFGSGLVPTKDYKTINFEHTLVDAFKDADEDGALDVIPASCAGQGTEGLNNFQYCKVCFAADANAITAADSFADFEAIFGDKDTDGEYVNAWFKVAIVAVPAHTFVDEKGNSTLVNGVTATCATPGSEWYGYCTACETVINATAGSVGANATIKDILDAATAKPINALNHKDAENNYVIGVKPTCDENAKCGLCGETITGTAADIVATGCTWVNVPDNATNLACGESGWRNMKYCSVCGAVEATPVAAVPHNWTFIAKNYTEENLSTKLAAVTCVASTGVHEDYYYCTVCQSFGLLQKGAIVVVDEDATWTRNGAPKNHTKKDDYQPATCLTAASKYECAVCGVDVEDWKVEALGHNYRVAPTCTTNGTCSVCGEVANSALAHRDNLGFTWEAVDGVLATCTSAGYVAHYECSLCNAKAYLDNSTYKTEKVITSGTGAANVVVKAGVNEGELFYLAPLGHDYKDVAETNSTCTEAGHYAYQVCANCGDIKNYREKSLVTCASSQVSCESKVTCNASHAVITVAGETIIVPVAGDYYFDAEKGVYVFLPEGAELPDGVLARDVVTAVSAGCGAQITNRNVVAHSYNTNGFCTVCGKECAHKFVENECTICGKEEN